MKISRFTCENLISNCVTDKGAPKFSFAIESEKQNVKLVSASITVNGWTATTTDQIGIVYKGEPLKPFRSYKAELVAQDNYGERAMAELWFETGRLDTPWSGAWITDGSYRFKEKKTSPVPITFRKIFACGKEVKSAKIYSTALGIYDLTLNGKRVSEEYFAPGFTSYKHTLQYQTYDITALMQKENELRAVVAGGWAVGAFVMSRKNRITADRQAFLAELRVEYADDSIETIRTDESWQVTRDGNLRFAEFYDGEVYDATVEEKSLRWAQAKIEKIKINPNIVAAYGAPVKAHEAFAPISVKMGKDGSLIYDFGQNFAGVIEFSVNAKQGQKLLFKHAEVLTKDGELNTAFLRSAKCELTYICKDGEQTYSPRMTYMGFRYVSVTGASAENIRLKAVALYSDISTNGSFECSDERINRLQNNIVWSGKSNFVDIPTDCPQRDERMGWTGDIAVFASTACYNFDTARFLDKWLADVRAEQTRGGGIPNTVPSQGYAFPATMPKKAIAFWGDACVFVPWALYLAYGDKSVLKENYGAMKRYVNACKFWAGLFSFGKRRYIWNDIPAMQFGDWVAPDIEKMSEWQARCTWTGTAALSYSARLVAQIAKILGEEKDAAYYEKLCEKTADAYATVLCDGNGKLKKEFQTAYVLPLYFRMFPDGQRKNAVKNLVALIERNNYCIGTGFPGTPYILFALADNGYTDVAYKMLTCELCPSWLYEVKVGATTIWERWDALDDNGVCTIGDDGTGGMISFNHYAFGAVGDFLYRRIAGIEAETGGYQTFRIQPIVGGGISFAKGEVNTPFGKVRSEWEIENETFTLQISVPVSTTCRVVMPSGQEYLVGSGKYSYCESLKKGEKAV